LARPCGIRFPSSRARQSLGGGAGDDRVAHATLNVNVAANVVSPANDFSNLSPRRIGFRIGGLITCAMGIVMQPWKLMADYGSYIFGWLVGYSGFLGPIAGVLICDYFVVRKKSSSSRIFISAMGNTNTRAVSIGRPSGRSRPVPVSLSLALWFRAPRPVRYAWFVGFLVSFLAYFILMNRVRLSSSRRTEEDHFPWTSASPSNRTSPSTGF